MRFGVFVPQGWRMDLAQIADPVEQFEAMTGVAQAADEGPWDSIWVFDHFHTVPEPTPNTTFECWTITSTLARDTERVNIGQMVGCNGYRNPALYAKIASTVDVASRGRLYAGIGAGWSEGEWRAYGYPWVELRDRMGAFREAVEIIHKMWTEDEPQFSGKYHSIDKPYNEPKGARTRPSLWIGGGGEQVTLKLVARFGSAANFGNGDPDVFKHKADVLRTHCDAVGRDYDEIIKSTNLNKVFPIAKGADPEKATAKARGTVDMAEFQRGALIASSDEIADRIGAVRDAGAGYIIVYIPGVAYDHEPLHRFAEEIIPQLADGDARPRTIGGG